MHEQELKELVKKMPDDELKITRQDLAAGLSLLIPSSSMYGPAAAYLNAIDTELASTITTARRTSMDMPQLPSIPHTRGPQPAPRDEASAHLTAIAARLTGRGITSRLTRLGGTPVLTIEDPAAGPNAATIIIDPDTSNGPGLPIDCTCLWTPAPGTAPEATADTIITVLKAVGCA